MEITTEIIVIEEALAVAGIPVATFCASAKINRSTWTRWKSGAVMPNMATWFRCLLIVERLATLNGIVYDDDEQIAKSYASKRYSELPGATVTVRAL